MDLSGKDIHIVMQKIRDDERIAVRQWTWSRNGHPGCSWRRGRIVRQGLAD